MSQHTICDFCQADIVWALTVMRGGGDGRKRMPLDAARQADGNTYANIAVHRDHLGSLYARTLTKAEPELRDGEWRAIPHFATCPSWPGRSKNSASARRTQQQPRVGGNVVAFRRRG